MSEAKLYIEVLDQGIDLDYGLLSLNVLRRTTTDKPLYQVHSDYSNAAVSNIHKDIREAVNEFIRIKKKVKRWV